LELDVLADINECTIENRSKGRLESKNVDLHSSHLDSCSYGLSSHIGAPCDAVGIEPVAKCGVWFVNKPKISAFPMIDVDSGIIAQPSLVERILLGIIERGFVISIAYLSLSQNLVALGSLGYILYRLFGGTRTDIGERRHDWIYDVSSVRRIISFSLHQDMHVRG
jgi:hypothetical protein